MTYLQQLQAASGLSEVAKILAIKPSTLSFLIYKLPVADRYYSFEIPKASGGKRKIDAPVPQLCMVQRRLANVLTACVLEIEKSQTIKSHLAHGYLPKRSILTNALNHKKRRQVLNIDLENFFPSLNFGRVRGYFLADARFKLNKDVATIIAQIACHDNSLPQGSPCSPIISNLLTNFLDVRLAGLAKASKVTYSRYVDDITFSTNAKFFPTALAVQSTTSLKDWEVGGKLVKQISRAGFKVNLAKTRMQLRGSRQTATGLMLNAKVNIRPEYYRDTVTGDTSTTLILNGIQVEGIEEHLELHPREAVSELGRSLKGKSAEELLRTVSINQINKLGLYDTNWDESALPYLHEKLSAFLRKTSEAEATNRGLFVSIM